MRPALKVLGGWIPSCWNKDDFLISHPLIRSLDYFFYVPFNKVIIFHAIYTTAKVFLIFRNSSKDN